MDPSKINVRIKVEESEPRSMEVRRFRDWLGPEATAWPRGACSRAPACVRACTAHCAPCLAPPTTCCHLARLINAHTPASPLQLDLDWSFQMKGLVPQLSRQALIPGGSVEINHGNLFGDSQVCCVCEREREGGTGRARCRAFGALGSTMG